LFAIYKVIIFLLIFLLSFEALLEGCKFCATLAACKALLLDSYCRVDLILSGGVPYCLEINTLPGMTDTSLLPLAARTAGISFPELCSAIIKSSLDRHVLY
jgi:D-alanine-D-alanine ligase